MDLKSRLGLLRRESGAEPPTPPPPVPPAVGDRVARLRAGGMSRNGVERNAALAAKLGGTVLGPGCLLIEHRTGTAGSHGHVPLETACRRVAALPGLEGRDPRRFLLLDTETTGLSGGSGTAVFLLGLARIEGETLVTRQYLITAFAGERLLLDAAADWLRDAEALVTYNGRSFDVPLLATRCRLAGVTDRFSALEQIDLLHPTRRAFARRWSDCRLATVERSLLGFARQGDLPGSEAPAAWLAYLHAGDAGRLPGVVKHNRLDLVSLAALIGRLDEVYAAPIRHDADVLSIARAHLARGDIELGATLLEQAEEVAARLELAGIHRRKGNWARACGLWADLAEAGVAEAIESLAKYYEHVARDPVIALSWASRLPKGLEMDRRRMRLAAKCSVLGEPAPS